EQYEQATAHYKQALNLNRELGERHGQAIVLTNLGNIHHAIGNPDAARDAWQQALELLDHLGLVPGVGGAGFPDADELRTKLHHLDGVALTDHSTGDQI